MEDSSELRKRLNNTEWRLNNLYYVIDGQGKRVKFELRPVQYHLLKNMWYLSIILKARQLGLTTFIDIFILDACLFNSNVSAGIIAHTLQDAKKIFNTKIKYAYDNLHPLIKKDISITTDNASELGFSNGSSLYVGTSMRSGTLQYLHVSELGKIAKKNPEKATEIKSGSFNTVHAGQMIFVESTAEGRSGLFFDMCEAARHAAEEGRTLSKMEFKFFFYPWHHDKEYVSDQALTFTEKENKYFRKLESDHRVFLSREQQTWYVEKWRLNALGESDTMRQEYPSTPEEAFEVELQGAYYAQQMSKARVDGRIATIPHETATTVNTYWDLGRNDTTVIWFHQRVGKENRFIDYYENSGESMSHYAQVLKEKGYVYDEHYLPHDANVVEYTRSDNKTRKQILEGMVQGRVTVVPRIQNILDGIQMCRTVFASCWFDAAKCDEGLKGLDAYRKEWDEKLGQYKDKPLHDWASNTADAFRQFAQGYNQTPTELEYRPPMRRR